MSLPSSVAQSEYAALLGQSLAQVNDRIAEAARRAGRAASEVRLVAVSKTRDAEELRAAYQLGLRDFGENYVQELQGKAEALADLRDLRFHLIGHLQRNKARAAVGAASVIHTVHSAELARELGKRLAGNTLAESKRFPLGPDLRALERYPVLIEVNVGGEEQKSGVAPEALARVLDAVEAEPTLALAGLMTVPPYTEDAADSLRYFEALARLRDEHGGGARLPELSMGMSHDLEYAIEAGATLVRVGTALFGERPPKPS
jgi:pyridoxal phosphate enzyme (YggS family)